MSRTKAFFLTTLIEGLTTFGGGLAGMYFVPETSHWTGYILGHVGGGFIFLVIHALLSEVFKHHPKSTVVSALAGAGLLFMVGILVGGH